MLGNKIEMEITKLIEQNPTILRLGLHLEYNDARHRIAAHLQRNLDRSEYNVIRTLIRVLNQNYSLYYALYSYDRYLTYMITYLGLVIATIIRHLQYER